MIDVILPNGEIVDNYSNDYRLYCEAKWLSTKDFNFRKEWLFKVEEKRKPDLKQLEKYLNFVFSLKNNENKACNNVILP